MVEPVELDAVVSGAEVGPHLGIAASMRRKVQPLWRGIILMLLLKWRIMMVLCGRLGSITRPPAGHNNDGKVGTDGEGNAVASDAKGCASGVNLFAHIIDISCREQLPCILDPLDRLDNACVCLLIGGLERRWWWSI
ncbi:hypothetical protein PIB30_025263 [Stylosanthes scabra]|uniref:Uncharacterized protein n=1 Tax=Stylosanthes scabra TaxID=79078 RepID=A0ABU6T9P1_9FABA|nr:hypothetical protein [Stylosanthes scabra]